MVRTLLSGAIGAVLASLFWIWFYGSVAGSGVAGAGDKVVVNQRDGAPLVIAEGVEVGPAGLAIPVAGVKKGQLSDTFTQARAGGRPGP